MGFDAVLLNTAVATPADPVRMARAFAAAIEAGRAALRGGPDGDARHGGALDAGRRHAVLRSGTAMMAAEATTSAASTSSIRSCPTSPGSSGWCRSASRPCSCGSRMPRPSASAARSRESLEICARHGCQLIVNDYWREALASAPTTSIWARRTLPTPTCRHPGQGRAARHQHAQRGGAGDRAGCRPTTLRSGPIYETHLKAMKWAPQGLDRVADWKKRIGSLPLVAIGGITPEGPTACGRRGPTAWRSSRISSPMPTPRPACANGWPGRSAAGPEPRTADILVAGGTCGGL